MTETSWGDRYGSMALCLFRRNVPAWTYPQQRHGEHRGARLRGAIGALATGERGLEVTRS